MKTSDIRRAFVDFFAERGHTIVPSSPLIPNDPTLLLTNAGMNQFKPYFLGTQKPPYPRAASVQKCARTTDIEIVGRTARHQSFFQMLGNFSFGDYYKHQAAAWAWELVTGIFGLSEDRLWVTIFETDDEAFDAWHKGVGIPAGRIVRRGMEDNFWSMGVAGPCGPCSEIFYDRGPAFGEVEGFQDGDRIMEFWNLVFMESEQDASLKIIGELPAKNVDTGMGLERIASILQEVPSNYETDEFRSVLARAEEVTGRVYGKDPKADVSLRILADHARTGTFLIADGVFPSNEDRGYVLRRLLRRAVRHATILGIDQRVLVPMAEAVIATLGEVYPELSTNGALVEQVAGAEEEGFRTTLGRGMVMLESAIGKSRAAKTVPGSVAFKLHDTYGFPVELTLEIAEESGLDVDRQEFDRLMQDQRQRARAGRKDASAVAAEDAYKAVAAERGPSEFVGHAATEASSALLAVIRAG
ncbi:MAG: alanine--tRNA ligase, partial [Actinomycetota bacterium]